MGKERGGGERGEAGGQATPTCLVLKKRGGEGMSVYGRRIRGQVYFLSPFVDQKGGGKGEWASSCPPVIGATKKE